MVLTAPKLVVPKLIQCFDEIEVAANLQCRMLTDGVMGGEEDTKAQTAHIERSFGWG
jgi:hypothetical protein